MKRALCLIMTCVLSIALLPACDVLEAMEITPSPSVAETTAAPSATPNGAPREAPVVFQDAEVEKTIRAKLGKPEGEVTDADMLRIASFEYNTDRNAAGSLSSLADLRWCKNLETLDILEQKGLTSIEPLRGLDKLWNVDIFGCAVSDLSPLAGSKALREIRISDCPVTDASPVLSLPNLEMFNAFLGTGISDISALSGTHNLKFFSSQKRFPDYTPLLAHKGLEDVSLTGITDEFFRELLANCRNLRSIRIISSDIRDESLSLLSDLHLYSLSLDNCGLEDISALAGLTSLQDLQIINNYVTDITPIGKLTQLANSLDIQYNSINDLTPLENLKKLANLTVTGNPYTDTTMLDKLEQNGCKVNR